MANRTASLFTVATIALTAMPIVHAETSSAPTPVPSVDLDRLKRPGASRPGDLFGSKSWQPPRRREAPPPPPPPPTAPPLPFAYVGRWQEKGQTIVVLARDNQHYIAQAGQQIDATYTLESVDNDKVVIRYMPLNMAQVLTFSNGSQPPGATAGLPQDLDDQPAPRRPRMPRPDPDDEDD